MIIQLSEPLVLMVCFFGVICLVDLWGGYEGGMVWFDWVSLICKIETSGLYKDIE